MKFSLADGILFYRASNPNGRMNLDNTGEIEKIDSLGMFRASENFPSQIIDSVSVAEAVLSKVEKKRFRNVVGCGMGGSAMGLELIKSWLQWELEVPFAVVRDYRLPAYFGPDDLALLVSYSGDTEETLSCMVEAAKRRSYMISMSSGGEVEKFSRALNVPHLKIPAGFQPRAALGYLFTLPLILLVHLGLAQKKNLDDLLGSITALKAMAERCSYMTPSSENPAKQLATKLLGSFPVIYGYGPYAAAALRFKQQLNENSKVMAKCEQFPELDHNDVEGFGSTPDQVRPVLVLLRGDYEPNIAARIDETLKVLRDCVTDVVEVNGYGSGISQLLTTIQICDSASLFLACLMGKDPGPVNRINEMKRALANRTNLIDSLKADVERLSGHTIS